MENRVNYTFVIGCARSGTSILGELIASHLELKYIFEASDIWELGGMGENESHRLTAQHATEPVKQQIREWFESQSRDANILVEKNPRNSLRIPYVKAIFPEAKFIHIVMMSEVVQNPFGRILDLANFRIHFGHSVVIFLSRLNFDLANF